MSQSGRMSRLGIREVVLSSICLLTWNGEQFSVFDPWPCNDIEWPSVGKTCSGIQLLTTGQCYISRSVKVAAMKRKGKGSNPRDTFPEAPNPNPCSHNCIWNNISHSDFWSETSTKPNLTYKRQVFFLLSAKWFTGRSHKCLQALAVVRAKLQLGDVDTHVLDYHLA